ncbi:MAG TPA: MFS transporter [Accumulibacter sp.]|nr:MFS transporter [Accumulibacter sp.]HMW16693.1 MFS transporter [Accumulibacter sp.]HMX21499.1 MFS transporter [Accumulibacter sp.]HMY05664.1 MFS transporter [Accumulibacter sp.]HNC18107.1 MFS transporter [Accumulibacter sp.]
MPGEQRSAVALVIIFCGAETASMAGFALVPSLLPLLSQQWQLSATEGGWLSGIFFLGYILAVPVLVSLTDRIDARRIYLASASLTALALAGFAVFADGLLSALGWWWLAGLGLAGTYMPGLKALTDRLPLAVQSRGAAFYTATFGVGAGLSYLWSELLREMLPWFGQFAIAAVAAAMAVLLVGFAVAPQPLSAEQSTVARPWRAVVRDRRILAFCGAYFGHNWELFGFRSWLVAYLSWAHLRQPDPWTSMPGLIAAIATFLAVPASILGNEGAHRWGRRRWLKTVMPLSCVLALAVALAGNLPSLWLVLLLLVYAASMNLDSAALTAGVLTETAPEIRGTALALYSSIGFAGGFVGPVAFGIAIDGFGRSSPLGWSAGFVTLACGVAFGRWAIGRSKA